MTDALGSIGNSAAQAAAATARSGGSTSQAANAAVRAAEATALAIGKKAVIKLVTPLVSGVEHAVVTTVSSAASSAASAVGSAASSAAGAAGSVLAIAAPVAIAAGFFYALFGGDGVDQKELDRVNASINHMYGLDIGSPAWTKAYNEAADKVIKGGAASGVGNLGWSLFSQGRNEWETAQLAAHGCKLSGPMPNVPNAVAALFSSNPLQAQLAAQLAEKSLPHYVCADGFDPAAINELAYIRKVYGDAIAEGWCPPFVDGLDPATLDLLLFNARVTLDPPAAVIAALDGLGYVASPDAAAQLVSDWEREQMLFTAALRGRVLYGFTTPPIPARPPAPATSSSAAAIASSSTAAPDLLAKFFAWLERLFSGVQS